MTLICILFGLLLTLSSCSEEAAGTGTMTIMLHENTAKTVAPETTADTITKFVVEGTGPGGKTFTRNSTSSTVVLEGMPVGRWELSAAGYNSKSKELARGSASADLSGGNGSFSIGLDRLRGSGSVQLRIEWDGSLTDVKIRISINDSAGIAVSSATLNPGNGTSYTTWTSGKIPDCSYTVSIELFCAEMLYCGVREALSVLPGEKTSWTADFTGMGTWDGGKSSFRIEGLSSTAASGAENSARLVPESHIADPSSYRVSWFLDSRRVGEAQTLNSGGNTVIFTPSTGIHVLSALVTDSEGEIVSSASEKFTSAPQGPDGLAVYGFSPSGESPGCFVTPVSNNRYVGIDTQSGQMKLFTVSSNMIQVLHTTYASDSLWYWLSDTNGLWGSASMDFFATADSFYNFSVMHVSAQNTIEYALNGENPERIEGGLVFPILDLSDFERCSAAPSSSGAGCFLLFPPNGRAFIDSTDTSGIKARCGLILPEGVSRLRVLEARKDMIICAGEDSSVLWNAPFDGTGKTNAWNSQRLPLGNITAAKFLTDNILLVTDGNSVLLCTKSRTGWGVRSNVSVRALDIGVSPDGQYFYVLENPATVTSYKAGNSTVTRLGSASLPFEASHLAVNRNSLIAVSEGGLTAVLEIIRRTE